MLFRIWFHKLKFIKPLSVDMMFDQIKQNKNHNPFEFKL